VLLRVCFCVLRKYTVCVRSSSVFVDLELKTRNFQIF
jgi:hypothetical protein